MKYIKHTFLIILSLFILTACETASLTVESGAGSGNYAANTNVKIRAYIPHPGQEFDHWAGDTKTITDVTQKETSITIPDFAEDEKIQLKIKATYIVDPSAKEYNLTIENGLGTGNYLTYSVVIVKANKAIDGKVFARWEGDVHYLSNPYIAIQKVLIKKEDLFLKVIYRDKIFPTPEPTVVPNPTVIPTIAPDPETCIPANFHLGLIQEWRGRGNATNWTVRSKLTVGTKGRKMWFDFHQPSSWVGDGHTCSEFFVIFKDNGKWVAQIADYLGCNANEHVKYDFHTDWGPNNKYFKISKGDTVAFLVTTNSAPPGEHVQMFERTEPYVMCWEE